MKKVDFGAKRPTVVKPAGGGGIDNWVSHQATSTEPTKRLTIEVPISLHKRFKSGCAIENLVMADVIREFLERRFPSTAPIIEQGGGES